MNSRIILCNYIFLLNLHKKSIPSAHKNCSPFESCCTLWPVKRHLFSKTRLFSLQQIFQSSGSGQKRNDDIYIHLPQTSPQTPEAVFRVRKWSRSNGRDQLIRDFLLEIFCNHEHSVEHYQSGGRFRYLYKMYILAHAWYNNRYCKIIH